MSAINLHHRNNVCKMSRIYTRSFFSLNTRIYTLNRSIGGEGGCLGTLTKPLQPPPAVLGGFKEG